MPGDMYFAIGHYDAPPKDVPPSLPLIVRGEFVSENWDAALKRCVKSARADVTRMNGSDKSVGRALVIFDDTTPHTSLKKPGHYAAWVDGLDDYALAPDGTKDKSRPTHRTLARCKDSTAQIACRRT